MRERVRQHLSVLYPDDDLDALTDAVLAAVGVEAGAAAAVWGPGDAVLISYGDSIHAPGEPPLRTLRRFLSSRLDDVFSTVHVLPFFPSSSDDGFAVVDYRAVDPALGTWDDIEDIAGGRRLMADLVLNHVSARHQWVQQFVAGESPGTDFVMTSDPDTDLSAVVRPRTTPLLRSFATADGTRHAWCTFSHDQVDVDFSNPDVLLAYLGIIDTYLEHGVRLLRLDAVAYAWKVLGTSCIHRPEVHELVRLLRTLLSVRQPDTVIVTETNVPAAENLAYLGTGDEAQVAYNFPLAPLLVDAILTGDPSVLARWLEELEPLPHGCAMLNFLASHDGIGVRPLEGLLPAERIDGLVAAAIDSGGQVSDYDSAEGPRPYELNVSLYDLLGFDRFVCAHTALLALAGVPAIYANSLFAAPGDHDLRAETGMARSINRGRFPLAQLDRDLGDPATDSARVFDELTRRLRIRASLPAFAPSAAQETVAIAPTVLAVHRRGDSGDEVLAVHEMGGRAVVFEAPTGADLDVLTGERLTAEPVVLGPYQCRWLVRGAPV